MSVSPLQTGMLLALLELRKGGKTISVDLSPDEQNVLDSFEDGFNSLQENNSAVELKSLLSELPNGDSSFLTKNSKLLVKIFLIDGINPEAVTDQDRQFFFRLMNSNFNCFQEFSDIMRGYYQVMDANAE
ncbi:MAG: hypothetical protein AAFP70_07605 [Calditrichota bacterium]